MAWPRKYIKMFRRTKDFVNDKKAGFKTKRTGAIERTKEFFGIGQYREIKNWKKAKKQRKRRIGAGLVTGFAAAGAGLAALFLSQKQEGSGLGIQFSAAIKTLPEPVRNLLDDTFKDAFEDTNPFGFEYGETPSLEDVLATMPDLEFNPLDPNSLFDIADEIGIAAQELWEQQFEDMVPEGTLGETIIRDRGRIIM
ncbi:MAG: hypothetical protein GPJ52_02785 [Candidatus Heimdallarchaeota archaeon]|nr:hypothetical protein [Candidatus Heimdallarchaeota archaeon]